MPPRSAEEKERRRLLRQEKKEARDKKKELEEDETNVAPSPTTKKESSSKPAATTTSPKENVEQDYSPLLHVPLDAMRLIMCYLPAQDLGNMTLLCRQTNHMMMEVRLPYILSRLNRPNQPFKGAVGYTELCHDESEARQLLELSFGGGDTGRLVTKKCRQNKSGGDADEFVAYARFLEESVCAYAPLVRA